VLHGRDAIRIICGEGDKFNCPIGRKDRHIQADSHINALLFEAGLEIGIL
jgi:hypothetical protein